MEGRMVLEWLTVHDFAVEIGESIGAVRWAIRRRELTQVGAYRGERWRVYAVKRGRRWYIPVLRDSQDGTICWFESRVDFERYKEACKC
jgi:hypothetical protein